MTTVVVLGYREGLDAAVRRRGLAAFHVVEKMKPQLAGREYVRVAHLEDAQEVLRAVQARGLTNVAAVVTGHEEAVFSAALVRAFLGTPGDRDHVRVLQFRDKALQKRALPAGVVHARCDYVGPEATHAGLVQQFGSPFVLKPANGFGSVRTSMIGTAAEFDAYRAEYQDTSDVQTVAESYVAGEEVHLDGLWQGGQLVWSCLSRYMDAPASWLKGGILGDSLVDRRRRPELCALADDLAQTALGGLDAPDTVFHLEAYIPPGGDQLVFGECAARIAGAMVPEVIELTYGVDLYETVLALGLGETPDPGHAARDPDHWYGYVYLRQFDGVELTEDDFRRTFDPHEVVFPTDPAAAQVGAYGRVGHAVLAHPDSDQLHRLVCEVAAFSRSGKDSG